MINGLNACAITNFFESNNVANKGLMELGGYSIPGVIMANNKVEARERAEKASLFFGFSFFAPLLFLPILNKTFLKMHKVADRFDNNEAQIMKMSKEFLSKDPDYMLKGINTLKEELKTKSKLKNAEIGFDNILNKFKGNGGELQKRLIKVHSHVLLADIILTGGLMGSVYWISNAITKKKTGRDGFSAEFEMADKTHVEQKAQKYREKHKNDCYKANAILLTSALAASLAFKKGMLAKGSNFVKKHAAALDYKDGIYMSRAILLVVTLFGDFPNTMLSSRDKEESKYNLIKNLLGYSVFFGGDVLLNNVMARVMDKTCKNVNLINKEKLSEEAPLWKKITAPLYSMNEITKKSDWAPEVLSKTKKCKNAIFWGNFAIVTAIMGFGTPYLLNKMLKNKVNSEIKEKENA